MLNCYHFTRLSDYLLATVYIGAANTRYDLEPYTQTGCRVISFPLAVCGCLRCHADSGNGDLGPGGASSNKTDDVSRACLA